MARCTSCQAPIFWAVSASTGKTMPIDAAPTADGNIVIEAGRAKVLGAIERAALPPGTNRYRSHFSTCPHAGQWRSPRRETARG